MNKNRTPVSYRPFQANVPVQQGFRNIAYSNGAPLRAAAQTFDNIGRIAGQYGDKIAVIEGERAGKKAALESERGGRVKATPAPLTSDPVPVSKKQASSNPSARVFLKSNLVNARPDEHVDGLSDDFSDRLAKLIQSAPADIKGKIKLNSGYRSNARQGELYQAALKKYGSERAARKWVAPPGRSQHNKGNAGDLRYLNSAAKAWVHANAGQYGLHFPLGHEPWHIEPTSARKNLAGSGGGTERPIDAPAPPPAPNGQSQIDDSSREALQLTGATTIYGRAFDRAASTSYLQRLDFNVRNDIQELYGAHRNSPKELAGKISQLKEIYQNTEVLDGFESEFSLAFDRISTPLVRQAGRDSQKRNYQNDVELFKGRIGALEVDKSRRLALIDPGSADADEVFADAQEAVNGHYDDAVNRGLITPSTANRAKRQSLSESAGIFYERQAEGLSSDDVRVLREELKQDFENGNLTDLDGATFSSLDNRLVARARAAERAEAKQVRDISKIGNSLAQGILNGEGVTAKERNGLLIQAEESNLAEVDDAVQTAIAKINIADAIRIKPVPEAQAELREARKRLGPNASRQAIEAIQFGEQALRDKQSALQKDPLQYAVNTGLIDSVSRIDVDGDAQTLSAQISLRIEQTEDVGESQGVSVPIFQAGEIRQFKKSFQDADTAARFASAVVTAAGSNAPSVLAELEKDASDLFQAGAVLAAGGDSGAATDVIDGYRKNAEGKTRKSIPNQRRVETVRGVIGEAIPTDSRDFQRIAGAAHAISRVRIEELGLDPDSVEADEVHQRAIHEAAGAIFSKGVQFGGFAPSEEITFGVGGRRVLVPNTVRADRLVDLYNEITIDDLNEQSVRPEKPDGSAYTQRDLSSAQIVNVPGGYWLALGDPESDAPRFIRGNDGKPFTLNLNALREQLEARVPGSYR